MRNPPARSGALRVKRMVFAVTSPVTVNALLPGLIREFLTRDWEVHIVSSPGIIDTSLRMENVYRHSVPMHRGISPFRDLVALWRMHRVLRKIDTPLVIGSTPKAGLISMLAARMAGVQLRVLQFRGAWWDGKTGTAQRLSLWADCVAARSATHVMANSSSLAEVLRARGVAGHEVAVLGKGGFKGVDLTIFHPVGGDEIPTTPLIGFAGRLNADKGIGDLLEVFSEVRRAIPNARLQIVGAVDETYAPAARILTALEATDGIELLPPKDPTSLAALMRRWTVLVFPSKREGMPNVVLEAAACEVPCVGWDVTGVRDAIKDGCTGFVVPRGDTAAMAARVIELWDSRMQRRMGADARERVRRWFAYPDVEARVATYVGGLYASYDGMAERDTSPPSEPLLLPNSKDGEPETQ